MKSTPFFHFLLYIIFIIVVYNIVTIVSRKTHETFDVRYVPDAPILIASEKDNKLRLFMINPPISVTKLIVKINQTIFMYEMNTLPYSENKMMRYVDVDYALTGDEVFKVSAMFVNKLGKSQESNKIVIHPKVLEKKEDSTIPVTQETVHDKQYISCHPNGSYTIGKQCIYNPGLMTNLTPEMYETLKKELEPQEKTYTMDLNLVL